MNKLIFTTFFLFLMPLLNCMAQSDLHSGTCGWGLTWTYSEETKTLTISGAGDMSDYDRKNKTAPWYNFRRDIQNIIIGPEVYSIGECAFVDVSTDSIAIPNSVARIGKWAFFSSELKSLTIPLGITTLEESTFNGCRSLSKINLPNTLTSIGDKAFYKCRSIISIDIPNKVTSIGEFAFWECTSLTSVTIPNSVTNIGYNAFDGDVDNTPIIQTIISLIENPFEIGGRALYEDNEYRGVFSRKTFENAKLYVPNGTIDRYKATNGWKDFNNIVEAGGSEPGPNSGGEVGDVFEIDGLKYEICESNTVSLISGFSKSFCDVVIPDQVTFNGVPYSVTAIGDYAFECCYIYSITIPNSVRYIGSSAFKDCGGLIDVYCYAETIPETNRNAFDDVLSNATLHVPESPVSTYNNTEPWCYFKEIVPLDGSGVQALEADNSVIQINSIRGERLEAQSKGINIIKMKDGTTKKVLVK